MKSIYSLSLASLAVAIAGCSGSGGGSDATGDATLTISLMDAPVDDVAEVHVEITGLTLKPADGPPVDLELEDAPMTVDLLELTEENAALLVDGAVIEAGEYEWLRMHVNASIDTVFDSYVVTHTGEWHEIFVPSGTVRLVSGFEADPNEAMQLIFDWDMRKGLVNPIGLDGYILKPAFRVIDVKQFGRLSGSIAVDTVALEENDCNADEPLEDFDVGNSVYIFAGHDAVPDDIDETDPEPIGTVDAVLNEAATHYEYTTRLPFGEYTVAFTCQAANDLPESDDLGVDPELDTVAFFEPPVNVTVGAPGDPEVIVDF